MESEEIENDFEFALYINSPNSPKNGRRLSKPYKTIHTESYMLDWLQVIGTIGGTLGLMIGFSFVGCITWTAKSIFSIKYRFGRTKHI